MNCSFKKKLMILLVILIIILYVLIFFHHESFDTFIKKMRKSSNNHYTKLSSRDTYLLEKKCLESLKENYNCSCLKKRIHFPEIINTSEDNDNFIIEMSHLGKSLDKLSGGEVEKLKQQDMRLNDQINCILSNLKRAKVYHADMHISGKNMTISENGDLGLIDFDIAYLDNLKKKDTLGDKLLKLSFVKQNGKLKLRQNTFQQFHNILKDKKIII